MNRQLLCILISIPLSGCLSTDYGRPAVITPQTFACTGGQYAKVRIYSPEEAVMIFDDKQYEMNRVTTTSGAKYKGQGAEFWTKSISALITVDGESYSCNFIPSDATGEEDLSLPGAGTDSPPQAL